MRFVSTKLRKREALWVCLGLLPLLVSCASHTPLRGQFRSYNEAYTEALNEQMLLNLARLENGHPAYYLAIGAINNRFNLTASATAGTTGSLTDSKTTTDNYQRPGGVLTLITRAIQFVGSRVLGYNASGTVSRSSSPDFQFIPLNNEAATKQVLDPISTDVFFTLYQQGYPIDQLMRVLIERIETTLDNKQLVLVNSPTRGTPQSYGRFLRACAILRELQLRGYLTLAARNEFESLGPISFEGGAQKGAGGASGKEERMNPTAKEFSDAADKGFTLLKTNSGWEIGRKRATPLFVLKKEFADAAESQLLNSNFIIEKKESDVVTAVSNVVKLLNEGIAVQTRVETDEPAATRLILRSFGRTMEAVASEQVPFDVLFKTNKEFRSYILRSENQPILRTIWTNGNERLAPPLQTVRYAGKTYQITDKIVDPLEPATRWNRDVFRLMVALASQVTVDISKFQRQVFEFRTD